MSDIAERVEDTASSGRTAAEYLAFPADEARALERDLRAALEGEIDFGRQARALFATDASNYRQVPIGVVTPRSRADVVEALRICRRHDAPVVARGGGTSLSGQGCNAAVLIDFSKHMNRILALDPEARRARVEPGCILDSLRDAAEEHHLTFGPDPATHTHNTLGGMIGNNSCGVHSLMSGRTSDFVEAMTIVTYDGEVMEVGPTSPEEIDRIVAGGGRRAEIYRGLLRLRERYGGLIEERYPQIPRRVSGYENLDTLLPGRSFNVAKSLVGSEGTCALVLEATLKLVPSPRCRALALLGFPDICRAADAVPDILSLEPLAIEGFDDLLYRFIDRGEVEDEGLRYFPDGAGWLIVEAGGGTREEAERNARRVVEHCDGSGASRVVSGPREQKLIWEARESALGATAFVPGEPDTWPGWEDSAVAPEKLGDYLRDLKRLFDRYGYRAAIYGHFGDGLIHCRINFELRTEEGLSKYRTFATEASEIIRRHGGSLSGEHGDGQARSALLEKMYGKKLVQCFRDFKALWDPGNRMNPGIIVEPVPVDANLRLGPAYRPPELDTAFSFTRDGGSFARATTRCVGVGKCRREKVGDEVMCPSYLVTREEKHSTRGRAHLLHEMVRGDVVTDGWDSREVEDALSLCLACKGCKSDCPVSVDIATYKAEFRHHHYKKRMRPRSAYTLGMIHKWARIGARVPGLANLLTRGPGISRLSKWIGGVHAKTQLPPFAPQTFRRWFERRDARPEGGERVLLWPDTFNNHFRPETAIAAVRVLEAGGFEVTIPSRPLCCGRALYDWGFLDKAKALWGQTFEALGEEIAAGIPVIGLEPACTAAFKDELPNLFPASGEAKRLSRQTVQFGDFVADRLERFPEAVRGGRALLQVHCNHHAVVGFDKEEDLLRRLGIDLDRPPQGCCGMAGAFGMERDTREVAEEIAERVLFPRVREAEPDVTILADGFSCREQIEQGTGRRTLNIAEMLAARMLRGTAAPAGG